MTPSAPGNAALYLHPNGYDTTGPSLMGRHSAGESFLRGFLRHADVEQFHLWNVAARPRPELEALLNRVHPPGKPVSWIAARNRDQLGGPGVLNMPVPDIGAEAWSRRPFGARAYAICGITHTTATDRVMRMMPDLLTSPCADYDALICTSDAVRASVETQLAGIRDYFAQAFGPRRRPEPQRVTIPLGVNTEDFTTSAANRADWRERLDIPDDAVVALYVGRFNVRAKMNPALMALALERAARTSGQAIYWVNSGWAASSPADEAEFHRQCAALCPSVRYRRVDGRPADVRFSIWSVADFFISFSDNIQETFGLTPVEAMAAGLPCVVSDWDGYRGTVRDGEDGFRIPTFAPSPGEGGDLAYWFANNWLNYDNYVGAAGQYTVVDLPAAERAIVALVTNPDLRRRMGANAAARARAVFDWAAIIPQYQALWAEQNARRLSAPPEPAIRDNPFRPDPFTLFAAYPTHRLALDWQVASAGMAWTEAEALLRSPLASYSQVNNLTLEEAATVVGWLAARPSAAVAELLEVFPRPRRPYVRRGLLWLARYGVIDLRPPSEAA